MTAPDASPAALPALTVALSMLAGILCQSTARHLRLPGLIVLLAGGVLLGPDLLNVIRPDSLGHSLHVLVGFAVAVILFEGGLNLNMRRLRREQQAIRRLLTIGVVVTVIGATLAARVIMGWSWILSILFSTLVIVTGPTVVTPLLRRLRVEKKVATVLEAEGVLIDAIGAITAVVALDVAISPSGESLARGFVDVAIRLGFGALFGLVGGLLLGGALRIRNLVPEGLENVLTLSMVFSLFQGSNALLAESGIAAVTIAGIVVGNSKSHVQRDLMEFKEQLTTMLIGMLFVLLAADVRIEEVVALGVPGLVTVVVLMLVVRPVGVLLSTTGPGINWQQKFFLSWIAPRGIVAAAMASLFATELEAHGLEGGSALRAMVFMVIAVTVLWAGLSGGLVAKLLGLRRPSRVGWIVLGYTEVGRALAVSLRREGEETIVLDSNPQRCQVAERDGHKVIYGNALKGSSLQRAELDTRAGIVAATVNDEVNLLFAQKVSKQVRAMRLLVAIKSLGAGVTEGMLEEIDSRILFGHPRDLELWSVRLRRKVARMIRVRLDERLDDGDDLVSALGPAAESEFLPLIFVRGTRAAPIDDRTRFKTGDEVILLIENEAEDQTVEMLERRGWQSVADLSLTDTVRRDGLVP